MNRKERFVVALCSCMGAGDALGERVMMNVRPVPRYLWTLSALLMLLFYPGRVFADQWFRGNTHAHTTRSDGNAAPEVVAKWYHDHNYNFLVITDHNKLVDPKEVKLPDDRRKDFLLIPGDEVSGARRIHATALNIKEVAPWKYSSPNRAKIVQFLVDGAITAEGTAILNHPNFCYALSAEDILQVRNLSMIELFNGHPKVNNSGDETHPSTEVIWDLLLTEGRRVLGVASDDAHNYLDFAPDQANPGRGWVMVRAAELNADAITKAMIQGDFYASSGVFLKTCDRDADTYLIEVDAEKTMQEVSSLPSIYGKPVENTAEGFRIEFIGPKGDILNTITGKKGRYTISQSTPYVRAKVTFTRKHPQQLGFEEFYAWGQPVFTHARAERNASEHE